MHGTVHEVVAERFTREAPTLQPLPPRRYDTAYWEARQVGWDAYVEVRGNRYSVPGTLAGRPVRVRLTLDGAVRHLRRRRSASPSTPSSPRPGAGSRSPITMPALWADTLAVERRPLAVYEEAATWS